MSRILAAEPLTRENFAPFGDVIDFTGESHYPINAGLTERYHALARAEAAGPDAHVLMSLFRGRKRALPLELKLVERHPFGSQAFMPLSPDPYLVIVCKDGLEGPDQPRAFVAKGQGVNYPRNQWHAVLTPLTDQDFLVVDRGGEGTNLEEFRFAEPWTITVADDLL